MTLKPPSDLSADDYFSVFLAGSIEMGKAENWQQRIELAFSDNDRIRLLNPRRDDWDSSWKQEKNNAQFAGQVSWELNGLEKADLIVFYFSPETRSPVSMLELGLFARSGKAIVYCPNGFWRKGNIDIVCERYDIAQATTFEELIILIKNKQP